jgi:hypothetical protein
MKTPYQRIVEASKKGVGVRLSAEECWDMAFDDAIATRAMLDDEESARATAIRGDPSADKEAGEGEK